MFFNYHTNSSSKLKSIYLRLFNILLLAARRSVLSSSSASLKYKSIRLQQLSEDYFLFFRKNREICRVGQTISSQKESQMLSCIAYQAFCLGNQFLKYYDIKCLGHRPAASYSALFTWMDVESSAPLPALETDSIFIGRTGQTKRMLLTIPGIQGREGEKKEQDS
jgi:hypothetical protein